MDETPPQSGRQRVVISRGATPNSASSTRVATPNRRVPQKRHTPGSDDDNTGDKENTQPQTPGFDDLTLVYGAGPAIEFPESPTMSIRRSTHYEKSTGTTPEEEQETDVETEINTNNVREIWDAIHNLANENAALKQRIYNLESQLETVNKQ